MKRVATLVMSMAAVATGALGTAATASAAPPPIPPRAFPIPYTKPVVKFSTEDSRLVFTATNLPRGEKVCLFEGYFGDPWFGSLGVNAWQPLYERYELGTEAKARSVRKPPGVYPVRLTCRMQEHVLVHRAGTVRIPNSAR